MQSNPSSWRIGSLAARMKKGLIIPQEQLVHNARSGQAGIVGQENAFTKADPPGYTHIRI